jgi:hypothetical protein
MIIDGCMHATSEGILLPHSLHGNPEKMHGHWNCDNMLDIL